MGFRFIRGAAVVVVVVVVVVVDMITARFNNDVAVVVLISCDAVIVVGIGVGAIVVVVLLVRQLQRFHSQSCCMNIQTFTGHQQHLSTMPNHHSTITMSMLHSSQRDKGMRR